jgi:hypothetical protein
MNLGDFLKSSRFLTAALLFFILFSSQAKSCVGDSGIIYGTNEMASFCGDAYPVVDYVVNNENNVIGQRAVDKINEMGEELFGKGGISVYVFLNRTVGNISVKEHMDLLTSKLKAPYVLLVMFSEDEIIDIISSSEDVEKKFNKKQILSPIPYYGTIKPLLAVKKDLDNFSAAILNGYADIVEQIAKSDNIKLESALGDANRDTLYYVRIVVYTMFIAAFLIYLYKRIKYRYAKKKG